MNRDEKNVLDRSEKPLKPLSSPIYSTSSSAHTPTPDSLFLRVITSQFAFFLEISSPLRLLPPENVDKSPACFKSLSNYSVLSELEVRSFSSSPPEPQRGGEL
jgi:hypothetical protein